MEPIRTDTADGMKEYRKACAADRKREQAANSPVRFPEFKHDTSLVGLVVVIPPQMVHLKLKKAEFA